MVAGAAVALAASVIIAMQLPDALAKPDRTRDVASLEALLTTLQQDRTGVEAELATIETDVMAARQTASLLPQRIADQSSVIGTLNEQITKLNSQIKDLEAQIAALEG